MRLKIKGEITPEHLAEALGKAMSHLESVVPGAKFYGANLYLTPYDADGMPFDLGDGRGNSLIISIPAPPGTLAKPALSAEAEQRQSIARESQRQLELEANARRRQREAEHEQQYQLKLSRMQKARKAYDALNELTTTLLASRPEQLAAGLNEAIHSTWASLKPVEPNGAKKGEPKPLPVFLIQEGKLQLTTSAWKNPRLLPNPVGGIKNMDITPIWAHNAWLVATAAFLKVLERLNGSLPEEILGDHLPGVATQE